MLIFSYLAALLFSIFCLGLIDYRYKLAYFKDKSRTIKLLLITVGVFVVWDFLGIGLDIFFHGDSNFDLPFVLLPEFPLEELFFLVLLNYSTLIVYTGISKWRAT